LKLSHDDGILAAGDAGGAIMLYDVTNKKVLDKEMQYHSSGVNSLSFNGSSSYLVSGGLDGAVYLWNVSTKKKVNAIRGCHRGSVNGVIFQGKDEIITVGDDAFLKQLKVKLWEF